MFLQLSSSSVTWPLCFYKQVFQFVFQSPESLSTVEPPTFFSSFVLQNICGALPGSESFLSSRDMIIGKTQTDPPQTQPSLLASSRGIFRELDTEDSVFGVLENVLKCLSASPLWLAGTWSPDDSFFGIGLL